MTVSFLIAGLFIIAATIWKSRRISEYISIQKTLENVFDICDIDLHNEPQHLKCVSHQWIIENIVKKKQGRFTSAFQGHMMDHTLTGSMWIGCLMGILSLLVGLIFTISGLNIGTATVVFFIGFLIIMVLGNPKSSEELMDAISQHDFEELDENNYMYMSIANNSIKQWLVISFTIGILFIIMSSIADSIPVSLAFLIAEFSRIFFWNPVVYLNEIVFLYAILYLLTSVLIFIFVL